MLNNTVPQILKTLTLSLMGFVALSMINTYQSYQKQMNIAMQNKEFVSLFSPSNAQTDALLLAKVERYSVCNNKPAGECEAVSRSKAVSVSMNYDIDTILNDEDMSLFAPKAIPLDAKTQQEIESKIVSNNQVGYGEMICTNGVCQEVAHQSFAFAYTQKGYSEKVQTDRYHAIMKKREERRTAFEKENSGSYVIEKLYGKLPEKPLEQI